MKKIALLIALLMLATATLAFGTSAETPADDGVVVDFNPEAITEDLSGINGLADQTPVQITGSVGITSLAAHSVGGVDGVKVSLEEENGEKFVRLTNTEFSGTYNQIFINMDASVFSPDTEYYFSLTIRTNKGFACNDSKGRALVARIHTPSLKDNILSGRPYKKSLAMFPPCCAAGWEFLMPESPEVCPRNLRQKKNVILENFPLTLAIKSVKL